MNAKRIFCLCLVALFWIAAPAGLRAQEDEDAGAASKDGKKTPSPFAVIDGILEKASHMGDLMGACIEKKTAAEREYRASSKEGEKEGNALKPPAVVQQKPGVPTLLEAAADCRAHFSVAAVVKDEDIARIMPGPNLVNHAIPQYYLCRALVEKNPGLCDDLRSIWLAKPKHEAGQIPPNQRDAHDPKAVSENSSGVGDDRLVYCVEGYHVIKTFDLLFTKGGQSREFQAACLEMFKKAGDPLGPAKCPKLTAAGDPKAVCSEFYPSGTNRQAMIEQCAAWMRVARGDKQVCSSMGWAGGDDAEFCGAITSLKTARESANANGCGDSPLCRALANGKPEACQGYADKVKGLYCGRFSDPRFKPQLDAAKLKAAHDAEDRQLKQSAADTEAKRAALEKTKQKELFYKTRMDEAAGLCGKLDKDWIEITDKAGVVLNGVEPRNLPGLKTRYAKLNALRNTRQSLIQDLYGVKKKAKPAAPAADDDSE